MSKISVILLPSLCGIETIAGLRIGAEDFIRTSQSTLRFVRRESSHESLRLSALFVGFRHEGESMPVTIHTDQALPAGLPQPEAAPANDKSYRSVDLELAALAAVRKIAFPPDTRVVGYLAQADIGPVSYGQALTSEGVPVQHSVKLDAIGVDHRCGYDLVRTSQGAAYVILSFAPHAAERGMDHLRDHIAANPDYYAARSLTLTEPWPHAREMVRLLSQAWRQRLSPQAAQERIDCLVAGTRASLDRSRYN
jgi:hypothetical protein